METTTKLLDNGRVEYMDKEGNKLYQEDKESGGTLLPRSYRTDEGGSTGFDISQSIPIVRNPNHPEREVIIRGKQDDSDTKGADLEEDKKGYKGPLAGNIVIDEEEELVKELQKIEVATEEPAKPDKDPVKSPSSRIIFDLGSKVGEFECFYHRIFKDGVCLVLVWNNRYHGSRYNPSTTLENPLSVYVGEERDRYEVLVGPRFTDDFRNEEYLVLFIKGEQNG